MATVRVRLCGLGAPLLLVALLAGACGQEGSTGQAPEASTAAISTTAGVPAATAGPTATTSAVAPPAGTTELQVTETEFGIALPESRLAPGSYTFRVKNAGSAQHDLVVKGPGVDSARTEILAAGQDGTVSATLLAGTYELWCSVGNHRQLGMTTTITVG